MKRVLLTLENPSGFFIQSFKESGMDEPPYAVLLLEQRISETYTIEPRPEDIRIKEANKTISGYDRVPHTHYSYEQACIVYDTEKDLKENKGVYWNFIPDGLEEDFYEYTARLVD